MRNYIRGRRRGWAFGAVVFRLTAVLLSGLATIMLGLADLSGLAAWGFALSAVVTLVTALEPFFNFRARWVSADQALARWHRDEEELTTYVATRPEERLKVEDVIRFDDARREAWAQFSRDWLAERRGASKEVGR
ncbi:SLATT domain-containing protein [Microbacterium arborescens]